jgi:hypothetical protein
MRTYLHSLVFFLLVTLGSGTSNNADLLSRADDNADELDEWLATAKRVSPEALKACPSSCSTAMANNSEPNCHIGNHLITNS